MTESHHFVAMRRQQFRRYFQPSRLVLCVLPAPTKSGVNVITVCFCMHCSYKPPMMAIAIHNVNASYELIQKAQEYVLAVPGASMAEKALHCGITSMRQVNNKVGVQGLELLKSEHIAVPGLRRAIANVELAKEHSIKAGDHIVVIGKALGFRVNAACDEAPLLSVGPDTRGYLVLAQYGIHRIGTVRCRREPKPK